MTDFAKSEWARAKTTLESARQLLRTDPDSAASRAYYAAFHAVTALFALEGRSFNRHSALRSALHGELIKSGRWPKELGKSYDLLMDLREAGDYGGLAHVSADDAAKAATEAEGILAAVKGNCPALE